MLLLLFVVVRRIAKLIEWRLPFVSERCEWVLSFFWFVSPVSPTGINTPSQEKMDHIVGQLVGRLLGRVELVWSYLTVVGGGMMLGVIVTKIVGAGAPVDDKLSLAGPVLDPIEAHVDGFGSFLFDGVVGEALSSGVVD